MDAVTARRSVARATRRLLTSPVRLVSGAAAVLLVTGAAITLPLASAASAHEAALDRYRAAWADVQRIGAQLSAVESDADTERAAVERLKGTISTLRASPSGVLPDGDHALLDGAADRIGAVLALVPSERPGAPEAVASHRSDTETLMGASFTLERQARREAGWLAAALDAVRGLRTQHDTSTAMLGQLVTGSAADGDRAAVPGLDTATAALLAAFPRADAASRDALAAAANRAAAAAGAGALVEAELADFVVRAQDVRASQEANDRAAAEAAARAAAEEARRSSQQASPGTRSPSGGASAPGAWGTGSHPLPPPPPNFGQFVAHNPNVYASGYYLPGCSGVPSYTLQAANHGFQIISLDHDYAYDYRTFSTADGWGVTVIDCSNPG
ncbi:hypothetical protein [Leifsonia sp. LS-T14]|uniref:hypothetical protein n=1 Tax=unclassified Leifsonia TaxID=2663824 RepID=UPI0035A6921C